MSSFIIFVASTIPFALLDSKALPSNHVSNIAVKYDLGNSILSHNYSWTETSPVLVNVVIHACNSLLLFHLISSYTRRTNNTFKLCLVSFTSLLSTLVFTVHPIRIHSLRSSSISNYLSTFLVLLGLIFLTRVPSKSNCKLEKKALSIVFLVFGGLLQPTNPLIACCGSVDFHCLSSW